MAFQAALAFLIGLSLEIIPTNEALFTSLLYEQNNKQLNISCTNGTDVRSVLECAIECMSRRDCVGFRELELPGSQCDICTFGSMPGVTTQGIYTSVTTLAMQSEGLLAYFPMDEAVGDNVSSYGLPLTLMGADIIPVGKVGGALRIRPDIDGFATAPLPSDSCVKDLITCEEGFSIVFWLKVNTSPSGYYPDLMLFGRTIMAFQTNDKMMYTLFDPVNSRRINMQLHYEIGRWIHVAWTYDHTRSSLYKDGCLHDEISAWGGGYQSWSNPDLIQFGKYAYGINIEIDAELDEVYFWEVSKSPSVFYALYLQAF